MAQRGAFPKILTFIYHDGQHKSYQTTEYESDLVLDLATVRGLVSFSFKHAAGTAIEFSQMIRSIDVADAPLTSGRLSQLQQVH